VKIYLFSLGAGLLVGIIYYLVGVRSPAPPIVALIGLLGMLLGEQIIPVAKKLAHGTHAEVSVQMETSDLVHGTMTDRHEKDRA